MRSVSRSRRVNAWLKAHSSWKSSPAFEPRAPRNSGRDICICQNLLLAKCSIPALIMALEDAVAPAIRNGFLRVLIVTEFIFELTKQPQATVHCRFANDSLNCISEVRGWIDPEKSLAPCRDCLEVNSRETMRCRGRGSLTPRKTTGLSSAAADATRAVSNNISSRTGLLWTIHFSRAQLLRGLAEGLRRRDSDPTAKLLVKRTALSHQEGSRVYRRQSGSNPRERKVGKSELVPPTVRIRRSGRLLPGMGIIASHVNIPSGCRRHQAKNEAQAACAYIRGTVPISDGRFC
jgi:hypothetical protein